MKYITAIKDFGFKNRHPHIKYALIICGHGGKIWQTSRLRKMLVRNGYAVRVIEHSPGVLGSGDKQMLLELTDEICAASGEFRKQVGQDVLLIGMSLGALMATNVIRRDRRFKRAILITGGDVAKAALRLSTKGNWNISHEELSDFWKDVNMYSSPDSLAHASIIMTLPLRDQLIDPEDVIAEALYQSKHGNSFKLIKNKHLGHAGMVIYQTIVRPGQIKKYIALLEK